MKFNPSAAPFKVTARISSANIARNGNGVVNNDKRPRKRTPRSMHVPMMNQPSANPRMSFHFNSNGLNVIEQVVAMKFL